MLKEMILVVDDEKEIADLVALYLQNEGFRVCKAYDAAGALDFAANEPLDLAVLDRKSTRLNSSHLKPSRMPSSA